MSRSAKTILVFGLYLCVLGFILLVTPNTLLGVLGLPLTTEVWIRILGGLVAIAGGYYIQAARHKLIPFFRATIWGRLTDLVKCGFASWGALWRSQAVTTSRQRATS